MQTIVQPSLLKCRPCTSAANRNNVHQRYGGGLHLSIRQQYCVSRQYDAHAWAKACGSQQRTVSCNAFDPSLSHAVDVAASVLPNAALHGHLLDQLANLSQHLSLAYERVALPCSTMNCGDAIYRR
jgi:hypothetical protein